MTDTLKPTAEEHAYHLGWTAYFNEKYKNEPAKNPFWHGDDEVDNRLHDKWEEGRTNAESVARSMADV